MKRRRSILAYQPRRPVPWRLFDVVIVIGLYVIMPSCVATAARQWFGVEVDRVPRAVETVQPDSAHSLARVLVESPSASALLLCVAMAVVIAPMVEETLFRLVLQGWLEKNERQWRRRRRLLRAMPAGTISVILSSLLFAALHFRTAEPPADVPTLVRLIAVQAAANLLAFGLALGWLRMVAEASWTDIGIVPRKLWSDVKLGLLAFLAATIPVYAVFIAAKALLPDVAAADPIPLFLLAAVLGALYFRTHRVAPSIVLHMAFNAASVMLALWVLRAG